MNLLKTQNCNTLKTIANNLEKKIPDASNLLRIDQYSTDQQNLEKKWRC